MECLSGAAFGSVTVMSPRKVPLEAAFATEWAASFAFCSAGGPYSAGRKSRGSHFKSLNRFAVCQVDDRDWNHVVTILSEYPNSFDQLGNQVPKLHQISSSTRSRGGQYMQPLGVLDQFAICHAITFSSLSGRIPPRRKPRTSRHLSGGCSGVCEPLPGSRRGKPTIGHCTLGWVADKPPALDLHQVPAHERPSLGWRGRPVYGYDFVIGP